VQQSRPYSEQIKALVSRLANASGEDIGEGVALLKERPVRNIGYVLITPDRGLSGALPSNINRRALLSMREEQERLAGKASQRPGVQFIPVGRKGRDFVIRSRLPMLAEFTNYGDKPGLSDASAIAQVAVDAFLNGDVDIVYLVYSKFVNTVTQQPTAVQLLPVQPPPGQDDEQRTIEYIYEPDARTIFEALLPRYVDVLVYQALLENIASFYSAQMVAMKNATDNANDLVQDLTLAYNKARQASITTQILEVVSGANALG
jgi:F-type H+-transporting ATPase subunit gamma